VDRTEVKAVSAPRALGVQVGSWGGRADRVMSAGVESQPTWGGTTEFG